MINADHMAGWYVGRRSKVLISCGTPPPISLIWFQCSAPSNTPPTQFCFLHCLNSPWWQNKINWTTKPDIDCDWTIRPGRDLMVVNEGQGCGWVDGLHRPNRKCRWCNDLIMTQLLYLTPQICSDSDNEGLAVQTAASAWPEMLSHAYPRLVDREEPISVCL